MEMIAGRWRRRRMQILLAASFGVLMWLYDYFRVPLGAQYDFARGAVFHSAPSASESLPDGLCTIESRVRKASPVPLDFVGAA